MKRLENFKIQLIIVMATQVIASVVLFSIGLQQSALVSLAVIIVNMLIVIWIMMYMEKEKKTMDLDISRVLGKDAKEAMIFGKIGIITFDDQYCATWVSDFLEERYPDLVGRKLTGWIAAIAELLQSRSAPALSDFVEKAGTGRIEISQLRLRSAMSPLISVESLTLEDIVAGSRIALVEARQFMIADQYINGSLRLTDIAIPPNLARKMLDQTISAEDIKQTLLTANQPLYRTMTLENGTFVYGDTKIACRRLSLDWRSNNPLHTISRVEQLDIPIDSASGLQQLRIDSEGEHVQRGNLSHDKGSIDIAGAGRLEFDLEYNVDFAGSSLEDDNLQSLLDTQLDKIRLRYEDKGGMALLLAVSIDNRESISQTVDMLEAQIPAALPGEDNRQLVEALRTTLLTPGTLELRLRDGMKMRMADILNTAALGRMLQASAVPGKENVKDQLLRILKQ